MGAEKEGLKTKLKKALPEKTLKKILPPFHYSQAVLANMRAGRPAKGMRVIGVTGTNGKTTTVTFIANILREAGYKVAVYSTTHYQIGDKYEANQTTTTMASVYHIQDFYRRARNAKVDVIVQEVTSQALEQHRVLGIDFEVAVMTNLSYEHQDYHGGMKAYANAKAMLFRNKPRYIVLNTDDEWFNYFNEFEASERKLSYGLVAESDADIVKVKHTIRGSSFVLEVDGKNLKLKSHLLGAYNVHNIAAAASAAYLFGVDISAIEKGVASLDRVDGRLEYIDEGQNFAVFTDYAHTPDGLQQVLQSLKEVTKGRLLLVQSAMDGRDPAKRVMLGEMAGLMCDEIFVTDEEAFELPTEVMRRDIIRGTENVRTKALVHEIPDRQEAINAAVAAAKKDDTVLIIPFGHQTSMTFYGETMHWDEREAAQKALKLRQGKIKSTGKSSSKISEKNAPKQKSE